MERTVRTRVGVSKTSTGKYSWDCTVELLGEDEIVSVPTEGLGNFAVITECEMQRDRILHLSDALVAELRQRYPGE